MPSMLLDANTTGLTVFTFAGLQTPRLKRLAEIVSAQAIAQEKQEFDYDEQPELADVDEMPEAIEASA